MNGFDFAPAFWKTIPTQGGLADGAGGRSPCVVETNAASPRFARPMVAALVLIALATSIACGTSADNASNGDGDSSLLLVYNKRVEDAGNLGYTYNTIIYDVAATREIASFQPAAQGRYAQTLIAGSALLFNLGDKIVRREPDGTGEQVLWEASDGGNVVRMAVSPDQSLLAFAVVPRDYPQQQDPRLIVFLNIASGKEILVVQQTAELFPDYSGHVAVPTWRDDGKGIVVYGWRHAGAPGGVATVLLDGTVRVHSLIGFPWVTSNGRYAWHGPEGQYMAECFPAKTSMILRDLNSDIDLTTLSDGDRVLAPKEWSPDSKEILYASYALKKTPSGCEGCFEVDLDSGEWHLLRMDGLESEPVADPAATLKRWQGDRYVELRCDGLPLLEGRCLDASGDEKAVDIFAGETFVGSGLEVEIVGFIER
ncbi:MAG: hypothetical protein IMZ46_11570 [Acidobacteria bacterium]|nr:hypothetical protein [Acidobacteriota bacterium]